MTPQQYCMLCQFAYLDLPARYRGKTVKLRAAAEGVLSDDAQGKLSCGPLDAHMRYTLEAIVADGTLGEMRIDRYENQNAESGFVAYAFKTAAGDAILAFRGSETEGCSAPNSIDWADNFVAPFLGSVQYPAIEAFVAAYHAPLLTGHSKGAHNALYALGCAQGRAQAVVFNGQGFAPGQISPAQKRRLGRRAVNYVTAGDVVGALLQHPEKRIFVEGRPDIRPHALAAFVFDEGGEPIPERRPAWSVLVEWGTRLYLRTLGVQGRPSLCEFVHN